MKNKLHPKAIHWFFIDASAALLGAVIPVILVAILIDTAGIMKESLFVGILILVTVGLVSLYIIFRLIYWWVRLFYNSYLYELTEEAIKIEKGVIWKKYISIPYKRIQNIDIQRGLLARILKLSELHIQTAGYTGYITTEGKLVGLLPETAEKLRDELINKTKKYETKTTP